MNEKTHVCSHWRYGYCVMIPVYYENETKPAWRYYAKGTLDECRKAAESAPEYLTATAEENRQNRHWKRQEMLLLLDHGKKAEAEKIRGQYHF